MIRNSADNAIATFLAIDDDKTLIFILFFKQANITFSFFVLKE